MVLNIDVCICTDEDFGLSNYKELGYVFDDIDMYKCTKSVSSYTDGAIFLRDTLMNLHIPEENLWIMDDILRFFSEAFENLFSLAFHNNRVGKKYSCCMGGNYSFTHIIITRDDTDEQHLSPKISIKRKFWKGVVYE